MIEQRRYLYLFPMTPEQVAGCLGEPVGAVGAHVCFEDAVVAFSIAHQVIPSSRQAPPVRRIATRDTHR